MHIREATSNDNEELKLLQAKCPQGTSLIVSTVNSPDFFARAKAYESYMVYVACEGDTIIASHACALRKGLVNGELKSIGYSFQTFVDPKHRMKNLAKSLLKHMESYLIENGSVCVYGLIMEKNVPSIKLVESLGFKFHRKLVMPSLIVRKEAAINPGVEVRSARPNDFANVAHLLNETWHGHHLYTPLSAEALAEFVDRVPGFSMKNLIVLINGGKILACLGFWDWGQVMKITLKELNLKFKIISRLLYITKIMPRVLKPEEELNQIMLTLIGFKKPADLSILVKYINNYALKNDIEQMFCICERNHPVLNSLTGFIRLSTSIGLYIKPLKEDFTLSKAPVFVDGIDM